MNEPPEKKCESILVERLTQQMTCYFVDCHAIWPQEVRRHLSNIPKSPSDIRESPTIRFQSVQTQAEPKFAGSVGRRSFVVLQINKEYSIERALSLLQQLQDQQAFVAIVGDLPNSFIPPVIWAGAIAVVTDIGGCDRLAAMLVRAAESQRQSLVGWKHRFLGRIPWPSE